MLDKPGNTYQLVSMLEAALPFEVTLTPELIEVLARQPEPIAVKPVENVSKISYLGDEGGIACHIRPDGVDNTVVTSLTHVRVARTLPFAEAVIEYQRHRVKMIRKQHARN